MGDEGSPRLFASKPKKSKLKAVTAPPPPPPPPSPPPVHRKGFFRSRYRVLVPLVLALNFGIGAYVLVRTTYREKAISEEEQHASSTSTV